jgi:hypothetical protein
LDSARVSGLVRAAGCSPAGFPSEHERDCWEDTREFHPGLWDEK